MTVPSRLEPEPTVHSSLIVYESMFGNTRLIAEAIAEGVSQFVPVVVAAVGDVPPSALDSAELVIVGAPTHARGLSTPDTRLEAEDWAQDAERGLRLEALATGPGVREWLDELPRGRNRLAAAFDTRGDALRLVSGAASTPILKALRRSGLKVIAPAESFLVTMNNELKAGQLQHARQWGRAMARSAIIASVGDTRADSQADPVFRLRHARHSSGS